MKKVSFPHASALQRKTSLAEWMGVDWTRQLDLPKERLSELHTARLFEYETLSSTQTVLGEHAYDCFFPGDMVWAHAQEHGRGRGFHQWTSSSGTSLTFSVLLTVLSQRESISSPQTTFYPQIAALATARALEALHVELAIPGHFSCTLKWPNDVFVNGKKISGVLIDQSSQGDHPTSLVVGVGINVLDSHQALSRYVGKDSKYEATSFFCETGVRCSLVQPLRHWLREFFRLEALWLSDNAEPIRLEWQRRSHFLGTFVQWTSRDTPDETYWGIWRVSALTSKGEIVLTRVKNALQDHKRQGHFSYMTIPLEELPVNVGEIEANPKGIYE